MIIDALNLFSNAQTFTTGSENGIVSTSSIDLGIAARDIGAGENLYIVVQVATTFVGTNPNATTVELLTDDNDGINSGTSIQTLGVIATNSVAGTRIIARIQPGTFQRYIALQYTAANALSAGAITAFVAKEADVQSYNANGFTIATS